MRKYYLFIIKESVAEIYKEDAENLYTNLKRLYINNGHINYNLSIYRQICNLFDPEVINDYFSGISNAKIRNNKYLIKNNINKYLIEINYSCLIILTNVNFPTVLKVLNYYNQNIFVCDFENDDYFWLVNYFDKKRLYEYN